MRGFLHQKNCEWFVKWTDLHSFAEGTHWMFTPLHPTQQSLWMFSELSESEFEDKEVNIEFVTDGYDVINHTPYRYAKIIIPVEIIERMTKKMHDVKLIKVPDGLFWFDELKPPIKLKDDNILKIGENYYKIKDLKRIISRYEN